MALAPEEWQLLIYLLGLSSRRFWLHTFYLPDSLIGPKRVVETFLSLLGPILFCKIQF